MKILRALLLFTVLFTCTSSLSALDQPIICCTLPKSGSIYISQSLAEGLNKEWMHICDAAFPGTINKSKLISLIRKRAVAQGHYAASELNIFFLKQYHPKLIVHVRDPRQALLSWMHHLIRLNKLNGLTYYPSLYYDKTEEEMIDYLIVHHLPLCIEWIQQWLDAQQNMLDIDIKFTIFEDLVEDEKAFFDDILDFINIPKHSFTYPKNNKTMDYHYRKGLIDEWRDVFTPEQQQRVTEMMPTHFCEFFGWVK